MKKIIVLLIMFMCLILNAQDYEIKIDANHVVLTDNINNEILFSTPAKDFRYKIKDQNGVYKVIFYDQYVSPSNRLNRLTIDVGNLENVSNVIYTESSLRSFLNSNTGFNSGSGTTTSQTAAQVNAAIQASQDAQDLVLDSEFNDVALSIETKQDQINLVPNTFIQVNSDGTSLINVDSVTINSATTSDLCNRDAPKWLRLNLL